MSSPPLAGHARAALAIAQVAFTCLQRFSTTYTTKLLEKAYVLRSNKKILEKIKRQLDSDLHVTEDVFKEFLNKKNVEKELKHWSNVKDVAFAANAADLQLATTTYLQDRLADSDKGKGVAGMSTKGGAGAADKEQAFVEKLVAGRTDLSSKDRQLVLEGVKASIQAVTSLALAAEAKASKGSSTNSKGTGAGGAPGARKGKAIAR